MVHKQKSFIGYEPPSGFFWGDYISAPRVLRPKIYTRARDCPSLDSAHPKWDGGPPKENFNRENLKFCSKFSVLATITSGLVEVSPQTFSVRRAASRGHNIGITFGRPAP